MKIFGKAPHITDTNGTCITLQQTSYFGKRGAQVEVRNPVWGLDQEFSLDLDEQQIRELVHLLLLCVTKPSDSPTIGLEKTRE